MSWFESEDERAAAAWVEVYEACALLARQLEAHADRAPYPQVAERLREIVADQEANAQRAGARLASLGRNTPANGAGQIHDGNSAWERLRVSVEDYRALIRQLSQLHARWDDDRPEDAALVRQVRERAVAHREILVDLLARSDSHARD